MSFSSISEYKIAPCTFLEPEYSPRSSCRTFSPLCAQRQGGGVASHAGANHDGIKSFVDHADLL